MSTKMWHDYQLTPKEVHKFEKWKKKLPKIKKKNVPNSNIWIKFSFTGIGTVVEVGRSDIPKKNKNITDYDSW